MKPPNYIPPCRKCGGKDFDLMPDPRNKRGLGRYCVPCRRARQNAWRRKNLERVRKADRENRMRRYWEEKLGQRERVA